MTPKHNKNTSQLKGSINALLDIANVSPDKINLEDEVNKWNTEHLKQFRGALGVFNKEKLGYILHHMFNGTDMFSQDYDTVNSEGIDKFFEYNHKVLKDLASSGINTREWMNPTRVKEFKTIAWNGVEHKLRIQPVLDTRTYLTLVNDMPEICTAAHQNAKKPNLNLDYLMDAALRTIAVYSETTGDEIGYFRLVALKDREGLPYLGLTFMGFTNEFKSHPIVMHEGLDYIYGGGHGGLMEDFGFPGGLLNQCCDMTSVNAALERTLKRANQSVKSKLNTYAKKGIPEEKRAEYLKLLNQKKLIPLYLENSLFRKSSGETGYMKFGDDINCDECWEGSTYLDIFKGDYKPSSKLKTGPVVDEMLGRDFRTIFEKFKEYYFSRNKGPLEGGMHPKDLIMKFRELEHRELKSLYPEAPLPEEAYR